MFVLAVLRLVQIDKLLKLFFQILSNSQSETLKKTDCTDLQKHGAKRKSDITVIGEHIPDTSQLLQKSLKSLQKSNQGCLIDEGLFFC